MDTKLDCIVAGHTCIDLFPKFQTGGDTINKVFKPGKLIHVGMMSQSIGGVVPNVAGALARLGIKVEAIGKVGEDTFGQIILNKMKEKEISTENMLEDVKSGTSYSIILNIPGIDRIPLHHPGANDSFSYNDLNYELIGQARHFHFGYPPLMKMFYSDDGSHLASIFKEVKKRGLTTSLDMARPDPDSPAGKANWKEILTKALPYVDLFAPSIEELLYMIDQESFEKLSKTSLPLGGLQFDDVELIGKKLIDMGTKEVFIKLGEYGAYYTDREISMYSPCFQVAVKGTIGSGDATLAGFIAARLKGFDITKSFNIALATGACSVEEIDSLSGIPTWENLISRIDKAWTKHPALFKQCSNDYI
jgi:sugar/nucleoside kinase (ribokinase family)